MRSASAYTHGRYTPTAYFPMIRFTFDVHEYLKGDGGDVIAADVLVDCIDWDWRRSCRPSSEREAIEDANDWISNGADRWWEDRESIIFLKESDFSNADASGRSSSPIYKFIPQNHDSTVPIFDYASTYEPYFGGDTFSILSERNRVWLPLSWAARVGGDSRFMLGDKPKDLLHPRQGAAAAASFSAVISLSELKSRIKAVADLVKRGEGAAGYEECLSIRYSALRIPYRPRSLKFPTRSGLRAGSAIDTVPTSGVKEYGDYFFQGTGDGFFEIGIEEGYGDSLNFYDRAIKTSRPLVRGDYSVVYHRLPGVMKPCIDGPVDIYADIPASRWTIRVAAPAGTLHEAFFDPAAIGAAVGADSGSGVLKPAAFPFAVSPNAEIRRVEWAAAAVRIDIANPPDPLAGHHIDFIALDGSVSLRLDFDDAAVSNSGAVRSFSWGVCAQPWRAGDKLMLRISESPADLAGATSHASCPNAPTRTPSPTQATTPTPTSMPDALPTPLPTPSPAPASAAPPYTP